MKLIPRLAQHFKTSEYFVADILRRKVKSDHSEASDLRALRDALSPREYKAVHFALNSNLRAEKVVAKARQRGLIPNGARRAMDIGAGYGGLTAAMADAGMEAVGIELEPAYVRLAGLNLAGRNGDVRSGDILELSPDDIGTFDFITCTNVIEHVADVELLLAKIASFLNPGGAALFEAPNYRSIKNVIGDVHHRVFGIQLLHYSAAERSHGFDFNESQPSTIGEMFSLGRYLTMIKRAGLCAEKLPYDGRLPSDGELFAHLAELSTKAAELSASDRYDWFLRTEITQKCAAYSASYSCGLERFILDGDAMFVEMFIEPVWSFVARKAD